MKKLFLSVLCLMLVFVSACKKEEKQIKTEANYDIYVDVGGKYKNDYVELKYIPKDFILIYKHSDKKRTVLEFVKDNENFGFKMSGMDGNPTYDTENATVTELTINGMPAVYSTKPNVNILVWTDGEKQFDISGNIAQEEIIKIAQSARNLK